MGKKRSHFPEVEKQIGKRIKQGRKLRKLTLEQLAHQVGVSYQQLQKYEKGESRVAASTLLIISQLLNLPMSSFVLAEENIHRNLYDKHTYNPDLSLIHISEPTRPY